MNLETQKLRNTGTAHRGFTLVEMLVVVGIIAILIGASLASYSKVMKSADKTKAQELVHQAATALAAIYESDGMWPKKIREVNKDEEKGRLDEDVALILAKRGYMSLSMDKNQTKLVGRDRFGILTPWAAKKLEGSQSVTKDQVQGSILNFVVDLDGDGKIDEDDFGSRLNKELEIRAPAAVWCSSKDGKEKIQSWTDAQAQKVQ